MADTKQPATDHHRLAAYRAGLADRLSKMQFKKPGRHRDVLTVDDAEGQLSTIVCGYEAIRAHKFTEEDKASMQVLFANYINEIWLSEFPPPQQANNTIDVVEALLSGDTEGARAVLSGLFPADRCDRILLKLQNVHAACVELFGANFCAFVDRDFDVALAMRLHQIAGKGVIEDSGKYRTKLVHACRSNAAYALPHLIAHRMEALFAFARETKQQYMSIQDARARTRSMLKLGTLFFSEFLLIHPFSNGNGRTARLLVNYLLRDTTVVPFSLFYKDRQIYLDVLEDRSNEVLSPPNTLAFYVLVCAARAVCDQLSLLSLAPVEAATE